MAQVTCPCRVDQTSLSDALIHQPCYVPVRDFFSGPRLTIDITTFELLVVLHQTGGLVPIFGEEEI